MPRRTLLPVLATLALTAAALASGEVFQDALFSDRTGFLLATPESGLSSGAPPPAADGLKAQPADQTGIPWNEDPVLAALRRQRDAAEAAGATPQEVADIAAMRRAATGDAAWRLGGALPPAVRLYTAAAVDFDTGTPAAAEPRFAAVLRLPAKQAAPRATWAAYMLGRAAAALHDDAAAEAAFAEVRALALAGAPDPLGLAVASYGEQARVHLGRGDIPGAVALYTQQWAHGDEGGRNSLEFTARRVFAHQETWPAALADPATRTMLIRAMVRQSSDGQVGPPLRAFYHAVVGSRRPDDPADVLAAMAYRSGDYAQAASFVSSASAPFSFWLRAKLALQKGDDTSAAALFSQALRTPAKEPPGGGRLAIEAGAMRVRRGDFVLALETMWPIVANNGGRGDFADDVLYLAERVVTTDELRDFVNHHVAPEPPVAHGDGGQKVVLRDVLAARLMRDGRIDEAIGTFTDSSVRAKAAEYRQALADAAARSGIGRAAAAWQAALLLRQSGMDMMGTWLWPDDAVDGGEFEWPWGMFGEPFDHKPGEYVQLERLRFDGSAPVPNKRFHYRYLAVEQAQAAVALVPARSQAAAAMLCQASLWMRQTHEDAAAHALWRQYVRTGAVLPFAKTFGVICPDPDFAAARGTGRRLLIIAAHDYLHRHKLPLAAAAAALLAVAAWGGWRFRFRRAW